MSEDIGAFEAYYEILIFIMFVINSIIGGLLGFLFKKFFNEVKDNQRQTTELYREHILLEEKVRSNKEILDQKINLNYQALSNNIESMHRNLQDQYKNILDRLSSYKNDRGNS